MLFNSFQFFLFFPVVTIIYFLLPHRFRWVHLLIASCVFYCAFIPVYVLILFLTVIVDYIAGIVIEQATGAKRKYFLILSLVTNIGILVVFKYLNFLIGNFNALFHTLNISASWPLLNIILPIGLSFHTFQAMSYTIEVYRGNQKAERHLGIYALYVMFYPQLVAGPIERPYNLLPQLHERKWLKYENVSDGLKMILWGMFKKIVIADRLATFVDPVFNNLKHYSPAVIILAVFFFSFQIYCDFSAYSDIAIGCARVMGFKLMTNFQRPYHSKSVSEFWKRWHISLSTWFRDYLYIPLGGNRVAIPRAYFNVMLVFLISGLWHGASWTFIIWGALHGFYLVFGRITYNARQKISKITGIASVRWLHKLIQMATTFCLVSFAWIFFRANTTKDAWYIVRQMPLFFRQVSDKLLHHKRLPVNLSLKSYGFILSVLAIVTLEAVHLAQRHNNFETLKRSPLLVRWVIYYLLIFVIVYFGVFENRKFIYFQF